MKANNLTYLIKSEVIFIEEPHGYISKENEPILGLTSLLAKHGITKDVSNIPKHFLKKAGNKGTLVHQQIEDYDNLGIMPTDEWAIPYTTINLKVLASEFLVNYENIVATQIDKILEDFSVCDIKTSREVDIQGVTWQCSIGAYMLEKQSNIKVPKIYCIHLREGKVNMFELERISDEYIEKLFECEENNTIYTLPSLPTPNTTAISLPNTLNNKAKRLYSAISKINQLKEQLDDEITEFMKENNLYSIKTEDISFTLVKPSTSETFDKKAFIKDNPTIDLSKYNKISERKGYLKTTLKK